MTSVPFLRPKQRQSPACPSGQGFHRSEDEGCNNRRLQTSFRGYLSMVVRRVKRHRQAPSGHPMFAPCDCCDDGHHIDDAIRCPPTCAAIRCPPTCAAYAASSAADSRQSAVAAWSPVTTANLAKMFPSSPGAGAAPLHPSLLRGRGTTAEGAARASGRMQPLLLFSSLNVMGSPT